MSQDRFSQQGIEFSDTCPDGSSRSPYRVLSVLGKTPWVGTFITDRWYGTFDHHVSKKTRPCPGPDRCEHCGRVERAWHAYAGFQFAKTNRVAIVRMLPNNADHLKRLHPSGESIRGLRVKMYRDNGKDNGGLVMEVFAGRHDGIGLWPAFDVVTYMLNVWRDCIAPPDRHPPESLAHRHQGEKEKKARRETKAERTDDEVSNLASRISLHSKNRVNGSLPGQTVIPGLDSQNATS